MLTVSQSKNSATPQVGWSLPVKFRNCAREKEAVMPKVVSQVVKRT